MKRLWLASALIFTLGLFSLVGIRLLEASGAPTSDTLVIYNWGDYIDPELLKQFEREYDTKVIYETFDTNEGMLAKIEQGGTTYDVAVPSEYMVEVMKEKELLLPLDHTKLPMLQHIDPYFLDLPFDRHNTYSLPYFWGTVGVAYNPKLLEGQTFESWDDLWDPSLKGRVIVVDSAREVLGVGLNKLGYSLNSKDEREIQQAMLELEAFSPNVKASIGDEVTQLMINEEAAVALTWSGQAADMMDVNDDITFAIPKEGSNIWFDNVVIPKTSRNVEGAHAFIDFLNRPDVAAKNATYVGYATANKDALALMDEEITSDERYYPPVDIREQLEVYENLGLKWVGRYNEYFLQYKMYTQRIN